jgi:hypothetical protein
LHGLTGERGAYDQFEGDTPWLNDLYWSIGTVP